MVGLRWKWLLLGLLTTLTGKGAVAPIAHSPIYLPLTIPSLVRGSDRIFVGRVENVDEPMGSRLELTLVFKVGQVLKGPLTTGSLLTLRMACALTAALAKGDQVLWFLPEDGPGGYSVPLGYYSGDFRVTGPEELAQNLNGNRGLWDEDAGLWDSGECSRRRFIDIHYQRFKGGPTMLRDLRWADSPYLSRPYPLAFFTAAVLSCLSPGEYQNYLSSPNHLVSRPRRQEF